MGTVQKNRLWLVGVAVVLAVAALSAAFRLYSQGGRPGDQLSLGQNYLSALDYEKAVLCFEKAIEVDPKSVDAYLGLADAYEGLGQLQKAAEALQKGLDATGDERLRTRLDALRAGEPGGRSQSGTERPDLRADELLAPLYALLDARDLDGARELMLTQPYQELAAGLSWEGDFYYYGETGADGLQTGKGLGLYPGCWAYLGDYREGRREGQGLWFGATPVPGDDFFIYELYEGEWQRDLPNGQGTRVTRTGPDEDPVVSNEVVTESALFVDGFAQGEVLYHSVTDVENLHMTLYAVDGLVQPLESSETGNDLVSPEGMPLIGESETMLMYSDHYMVSVSGLAPEDEG